MMPIEEIRKIVKNDYKPENNKLNEKLFNLFSSVGLILGLIIYIFSFGILFGFVVFLVWGFKKMIGTIKNICKKGNNITKNDDIIENLNKEE